MKNNKGFAPVLVLVILLGVLAVGGVAYFAGKSTAPKNEISDNSNNYPPVDDRQLVSNQPKEEGKKEAIVSNDYFSNLKKEIKVSGEIKSISDSGIVVASDKLIFLDEAGNIKREEKTSERTNTNISKSGNLIGQTTAYGISEKGPDGFNFKMFNRDMVLLWKSNKVSNIFFLSEAKAGSVFVPDCGEGGCYKDIRILTKNNPSGSLIKTSLSPRAEFTGGDISDDGNYFAGGYNIPNGNYSGDFPYGFSLLLLDINGKQIWKYDLSKASGNEVSVSPHGNYVIATIRTEINGPKENNIYILNKQGQIILTYAVPFVGNYRAKFSDDEKQVAVSSSNGELYLFEIDSLKLQWKYSINNKNINFMDLDMQNGLVAVAAAERNPADFADGSLPRYVYLLDQNGKLSSSKKFIDSEFNSWTDGPKVKFSSIPGISMIVALKDKIMLFGLK